MAFASVMGRNGEGGGSRSGSAGGEGGLRPVPHHRSIHEQTPILGPLERRICGHDEARREWNRRAAGAGNEILSWRTSHW